MDESIPSMLYESSQGSWAAARALENEIERRQLQDDYVRILLSIVAPDGSSVLTFWKVLRATPEQRAAAFREATT